MSNSGFGFPSISSPTTSIPPAAINSQKGTLSGKDGNKTVKLTCCTTSTMIRVCAVVGAILLVLGAIALLSLLVPNAGPFTQIFQQISQATETLARSMGMEALALAYLGASTGGGVLLIGCGIAAWSLKKDQQLSKPHSVILQNPTSPRSSTATADNLPQNPTLSGQITETSETQQNTMNTNNADQENHELSSSPVPVKHSPPLSRVSTSSNLEEEEEVTETSLPNASPESEFLVVDEAVRAKRLQNKNLEMLQHYQQQLSKLEAIPVAKRTYFVQSSIETIKLEILILREVYKVQDT